MRIVRTKAELREALAAARRDGRTIGLVPTMGYLHDGHLSLLEAARERCDVVVMSLFVNPAQFGPGEDLDAYPRDEARDAELAEAAGVDLVYAPDGRRGLPGRASPPSVEVGGGLTEVLCGDPRARGPEHFRGVTTVVAKLLNIVGPDVAFFGQKDAQQAVVIRRMVRDLDFPVEIEVLPTVREPDGLAMSSRNAYLDRRPSASAPRRSTARSRRPSEAAAAGERSAEAALGAARGELDAGRHRAGVPRGSRRREPEPVESFNGRPVLVAVAARVGRARLIDNVDRSKRRSTARQGQTR